MLIDNKSYTKSCGNHNPWRAVNDNHDAEVSRGDIEARVLKRRYSIPI
jgi:hypothetical protein